MLTVWFFYTCSSFFEIAKPGVSFGWDVSKIRVIINTMYLDCTDLIVHVIFLNSVAKFSTLDIVFSSHRPKLNDWFTQNNWKVWFYYILEVSTGLSRLLAQTIMCAHMYTHDHVHTWGCVHVHVHICRNIRFVKCVIIR